MKPDEISAAAQAMRWVNAALASLIIVILLFLGVNSLDQKPKAESRSCFPQNEVPTPVSGGGYSQESTNWIGGVHQDAKR